VAESKGAAKNGLKEYIVESTFKNILSAKFFAVSSLFPKFKLFFFVILLNASTQNTQLLHFCQGFVHA